MPPVKSRSNVGAHLDRLLASRAPAAASLVVSVFGDAVAPYGGAIWLGSLIRWLAPFGVNERAVRTAVHRLTAGDWFARRTTGRRSDVHLTTVSRHRFADAERRIYAAAPPAWNGRWCVLVLGLGGMSTALRDRARRELRWHGFGELAPNVLVHPSADLDELALALRDLAIERRTIVLSARGEDRVPGHSRPLRDLVETAWDLRNSRERYRDYVRRFRPVLAELRARPLPSPEVCFRARVLAIHEYRRVLLRDPELPLELSPGGWVGDEARRLCADLYRRVEAQASAYALDSGETATGRLRRASPLYACRFAN